jgi:predicted metal-dependent peptidase
MDASKLLHKAKFQAATSACPFFGAAAMSLEDEVSDKVPTAATNGRKLLVNGDWFSGLNDGERVFVVAHETCHFVLLHCDPSRMALMPDHERANVAMDYVVNLMLVESGMSIPNGCLFDRQYEGMTAEQVYRLLPAGGGKGKGGPQGGKWEKFSGDVQECPEGEVDAARQEAASAVSRGVAAGNAPAGMVRELAKVLDKPRSLADNLREFVQNSAEAAVEYSYRRPSMMAPAGFCMPSLLGEELPPVVVLMDTSGSIDEDSLAQSAAELGMVAEELRISELRIVYVDTQIHGEPVIVKPGDEIKLVPLGGGGTDFRSAFAHFAEHWADACCIVGFSDLYATFPAMPPSIPVVWVEVGRYGNGKAPWGKVVPGKR